MGLLEHACDHTFIPEGEVYAVVDGGEFVILYAAPDDDPTDTHPILMHKKDFASILHHQPTYPPRSLYTYTDYEYLP